MIPMICDNKMRAYIGRSLTLIIFAALITLILYLNLNLNFYRRLLDLHKVQNYCSDKYGNETRRNSRYVLSYSLFGRWIDEPGWYEAMGHIAQEMLDSDLYKDWSMRVYHDKISLKKQNTMMSKYPNMIFCDAGNLPVLGNYSNMGSSEWRFLPIGDPEVDIICSRDVDSPILQREVDAVKQWMNSNYYFNLNRDHPQHGANEILAGLWCAHNQRNRTRSNQILKLLLKHHYVRRNNKQPPKLSDQWFLRDHVWPLIKNDVMQHDSHSCFSKTFTKWGGLTAYPSPRAKNTSEFLGCKRPCKRRTLPSCPKVCRPSSHQDWLNC